MEPPAALTRRRGEVDQYLRALLDRREPAELYRMLGYHMGWEDADGRPADHPGKGLRPAFCLLACEAAGGDPARALPGAAALELVHNFSLIHDDIQDGDRLRHGRETVWTVWGQAQAINAGDALLALADVALGQCADRGVGDGVVAAAGRILHERTLEMVEGQVMDLSFEARTEVSLDEYIAMISRKTGALFDAALAIGAVLGGAPETMAGALSACGRSLGVAFQVRDDMLGIWGAENRTGKERAADVRRRKKSLPIVYGFDRAGGETRTRLEQVYGSADVSEDDVSFVLRALDEQGAEAYCSGIAEEYRALAMRQLDAAGLGDKAADIREAAQFLLERDY